MNKNNIEKIFKQFIKKELGYSLLSSTLFLITGGISLSTETINSKPKRKYRKKFLKCKNYKKI